MGLVECIRGAFERISDLAGDFRESTDEFGVLLNVPWDLRRAAIQIRGFILNADHLASFGTQSLAPGLESSHWMLITTIAFRNSRRLNPCSSVSGGATGTAIKSARQTCEYLTSFRDNPAVGTSIHTRENTWIE